MLSPRKQNRRSIRLKGYDYSKSGGYFITLVTKNMECLFGNVLNGKMVLNDFGEIVKNEWIDSERIRREIELDEFIIMPNHLHGIVFIVVGAHDHVRAHDHVGAHGRAPLRQPKSIGSFIAGFKSAATKQLNIIRSTPGIPVWQRNYYEHVIRNDTELNRIREYVIYNPLQWDSDDENPDKVHKKNRKLIWK